MSAAGSELASLYRNTVLDHSRRPRNFGRLDAADREAQGHNPLCGDKVTVYLQTDDRQLRRLQFEGVGCAICMASASLMSEAVQDQSLDEVERLTDEVLLSFADPAGDPDALPGELRALAGVRRYPSRVKCATLPWKTLLQALHQDRGIATTE